MPYPITKSMPYILDKKKCALLIIDMQNDFVREGAKLEVPRARDTIEVHQELIRYFRSNGMQIIYTKFISGPKYALVWEWSPVCGPEDKTCWRGVKKRYLNRQAELAGDDIIDELYPQPGDIVLEKYGYDAFYNTILEDVLRSHDIQCLVATGTVSQICVEDTIRGAFHRQFKCVVAEDAVSSFSDELQANSLRGLEMKYCRVARSAEIMEELEGIKSVLL